MNLQSVENTKDKKELSEEKLEKRSWLGEVMCIYIS